MDLKVPKKYDPTIARRSETLASEPSYSESIHSDEEEKDPSVPLSQYISLQQKFQYFILRLLTQEFEICKETNESSKQFENNCLNILNHNITEYKLKIDELAAKDELNMKYIAALEKAVLEYQKATGKRIPVEIPNEMSFKQLMKMSHNSKLSAVKLEYEQKLSEADRKYRSDIKTYRDKISELMKLLKDERVKSINSVDMISQLTQKMQLSEDSTRINDLTSKLKILMEKYKQLYSAYEQLQSQAPEEIIELHTPSFRKDQISHKQRMF